MKNQFIKTANLCRVLGCLYKDELKYLEEISTIEYMFHCPDLMVLVDSPDNIGAFFMLFNHTKGTASAFLDSNGSEEFTAAAADILKDVGKTHLQTGGFESEIIKKLLDVTADYDYVMMTQDEPAQLDCPGAFPTRLSADMPLSVFDGIYPGIGDSLRERARRGALFAMEDAGLWVAVGGATIKTVNYEYIFIDVNRAHRGKGYGKAIAAHTVNDIVSKGKTPVYALDPLNAPSKRLAEKMGFKKRVSRKCIFVGKWELKRTEEDDEGIPNSSFYC